MSLVILLLRRTVQIKLFNNIGGRYLIKLGAVSWGLASFSQVLIQMQLTSLWGFSILLAMGRVIWDPVAPLLATANTYDQGSKGGAIQVFSQVHRDQISSCSLAFCVFRLFCSNLIYVRSAFRFLIVLPYLTMMFFRSAISPARSLSLTLFSPFPLVN